MSGFLLRRALLSAIVLLPAVAFGRAVTAGQAVVAAADPAGPVAALDAGLLAVMRAGRATPFEARMQILLPVIEQSFDLPLILQNSIGPRFSGLPAAQQAELLTTMSTFTAASYVANFDAYSGERFDVLPEMRKAGTDEVVQTRIVGASGEPVRLDYVVRPSAGSFRIVDVLLDGSISRVAVQRSDFRSLVSTGDAAPLIASLRNKIAGLAAGNKA